MLPRLGRRVQLIQNPQTNRYPGVTTKLIPQNAYRSNNCSHTVRAEGSPVQQTCSSRQWKINFPSFREPPAIFLCKIFYSTAVTLAWLTLLSQLFRLFFLFLLFYSQFSCLLYALNWLFFAYFYTAKLGNIFCTLPNFAIPFLSTSCFFALFFCFVPHSQKKNHF